MNEETAIAIVGMACRFPGATSASDFWQNLADGVDSITRLTDEQILAAGVPKAHLENPSYVKAAPILESPGDFDAAFFGFTPSEARSMDPQHRILLELAYEALEDAGCDTERYRGRVGVLTGSAMNTYFTHTGQSRELAENYIPTLIGNDKDFLSTRLSYKLNLKGPSLTIQTACSTSLVAVHLACQSLLTQETDMALAGAISVRVPHEAGYFCDAGGVVSPDGRVKAFDASANGTVFGSGGGIIALKRLADALEDGDQIHAVILGSAVNNDGSEKAGYTAPGVNSQAEAAVEAMANAGVSPEDIGYVEAHGSGTPVGDPIEIKALTKAFRSFTDRTGFCAIGSVKTNIGHLDAAAGIASIIKTVLALKHRQIPASLHYEKPNPEIDFPSTPFYVNTRLTPWRCEGPRLASVVSTGMGGTNANLILQEAPAAPPAPIRDRPQLLVLSARSEPALAAMAQRLQPVSDGAAFTLQTGRRAMAHRRYVVGNDLAAKPKRGTTAVVVAGEKHPLVMLLPGVGDHYVGMGRELYLTFPVFREAVDRCSEVLGFDVREVLYPKGRDWQKPVGGAIDLKKMLAGNLAGPDDEDSRRLNQAAHVQPALFTIEYAMAQLWMGLGLAPQAIVGHSMGEYVAATLAGVFSLEDALRLIVRRTQLVSELPPAAMLSISLPEAEVEAVLPEGVSIALINGYNLCVVAGPPQAIEELRGELAAREVLVRAVQNTHAFHSRMLDPIVAAFEGEVRKVQRNRPKIPYISNVTGRWATDAEALDPCYWARHLNHTARFNDALGALWAIENPVLLEVGPGKTLCVLASQHPAKNNAVTISSLRQHYENQSDTEVLLHAVGKLWLANFDIRWEALYPEGRPRKVSLPTYPFQRENYWLAPQALSAPPAESGPLDFERWFHVPSWERTPPLTERDDSAAEVLVFGENAIDPREDCLPIFRRLKESGCREIRIVHLGCLESDATQEAGFFSLLRIARAIGELGIEIPVKIAVASRGLHQVTGEEELDPTMAPVLGACGVIPKELPNITCFNVDFAGEPRQEDLQAELMHPNAGEVIAYRGRHRWRRKFVPVTLSQTNERLRERGIYLITGGTGGIGLAVAHYLAQTCRARLVLTKKGPFPEDHPARRQIDELRALGAEVEVMTGESSDLEAMRTVITATKSRFGAINGVIHGAGIVRAGMALTKSREVAESVLAPKVAGTWILDKLLADESLDFLVLFSSITAVTTPFAECDYSGANAFLDAYAHFAQPSRPYPVISINWPGWKEVGQLANLQPLPGTEAWKEAALEKAIRTKDGVEAFRRVLASGLPQVVVSPTDLEREMRESHLPAGLPTPQARPVTPSAPVVRADEVLECIIDTWRQVLGFEEIDQDDGFFELGGHSLLLIRVHRDLCQRLGREIAMLTLLEHATPRALARFLSNGNPPSSTANMTQARLRADRQRRAMVK